MKEYILVHTWNNRHAITQVDAQPNPLNDDTFICKYEDRGEKWRVVDKATGMMISCGKTKKECIQRFVDLSSRYLEYKEKSPNYQKLIIKFNELRKEVENG